MKKIIKQILIKVLQPFNNRLGFVSNDIIKNEFLKDNLLDNLFLNLKKIGFQINHIVDVGANTGTWTRKIMDYYPNAYFTLIEPQIKLRDLLLRVSNGNKKIALHHVGAGSQEGTFLFTLHDRDDSCSFNITTDDAKRLGYTQIEIPVKTLNNLLKTNDWPIPELIKIDAEGLDIEVLKGASYYFGKTEIFMVEVGIFIKGFENDFLKMINFMNNVGYTLFDISDLNRPFNLKVLWLAELVFVRKDGVINNYKIN